MYATDKITAGVYVGKVIPESCRFGWAIVIFITIREQDQWMLGNVIEG